MEKYEYKTLTYDTKGFWGGSVDSGQFQNELNVLGNDGWELVSSISTTQKYGSSKSKIIRFYSKGQSPEDIAHSLDVSIETVRDVISEYENS